MEFEKEYNKVETAAILNKFISRYVDKAKLPNRILLWNSLKDGTKTECLPFSQLAPLHFFDGKTLFVYDEREKRLCKAKWEEISRFISSLEPWEENIDLLLFDNSYEWFAAVTHEDLLTVCGGTLLNKK